jgi:hypothetical protein
MTKMTNFWVQFPDVPNDFRQCSPARNHRPTPVFDGSTLKTPVENDLQQDIKSLRMTIFTPPKISLLVIGFG